MKILRIAIIISLFSYAHISHSQKLKSENFQIKYLRPPLSEIETSKYLSFIVHEKRYTSKGNIFQQTIKSGTLNYDKRTRLFLSPPYLGVVNGFQIVNFDLDPRLDTTCKIVFNCDEINIKNKQTKKGRTTTPTGELTNIYSLSVSLPMSLTFYRNGNVLEYSKNNQETQKSYNYEFPKDYSGIKSQGYNTTVELEADFAKHWPAFRLEIRNQIIKQWIYQTKNEISSNFKTAFLSLDIPIYYIKNKKGGYESVDALVSEMKSILQNIVDERNKGKNVNWHSKEIKQSWIELTVKWEKEINDQLNANKINPEQEVGLWANYCWSLFFSGEIDRAIQKAEELTQRQIENPKDFKKNIKLAKFISFANDYKLRYTRHKSKYGW